MAERGVRMGRLAERGVGSSRADDCIWLWRADMGDGGRSVEMKEPATPKMVRFCCGRTCFVLADTNVGNAELWGLQACGGGGCFVCGTWGVMTVRQWRADVLIARAHCCVQRPCAGAFQGTTFLFAHSFASSSAVSEAKYHSSRGGTHVVSSWGIE